MRKKIFTVLIALVLTLGMIGCGSGAGAGSSDVNVKLAYHDYNGSEDYNHETVYRNDLETIGADPSVIYITEGEQKGYYYMYLTSDDIGVCGFLSYRSKDLNTWECMGVAYLPTLYTDSDGVTYSAFASSNYWAPECIYDNGLYYLFYNASYLYRGLEFYMDVVISKNPNGPFVPYAQYIQDQEGVDQAVKDAWKPKLDNAAAGVAELGDGNLYVWQPLIDFRNMAETDPLYEAAEGGYMKTIDASPFIDPKTGTKYLYFCHDLGGRFPRSGIYVMEMNADWTPKCDENGKYKTVKSLIEANHNGDGTPNMNLGEGNVNEGPFTVYNEESGKYYLTYSANDYRSKSYQVRVAVSDSPTGPFKKLTRAEGGYLLYAESTFHWASGTGHHSFVSANGKTYIVYHAHTARINAGDSSRGIAFDELHWVANSDGLLVPYVNGPSYSYMPQTTGQYDNIATEATVTSTNIAEDSDVKYLNDGLIKIHNGDVGVQEFTMNAGSAVITLTFDDYREIRGLFVFNSKDYETAFGRISKVEFSFKDETKGVTGTAYTDPLDFDWDRYTDDEMLIAGSNFAIEFAPLMVKEIRITLPNVPEVHAISEIMVLGK